MRNIHPDRVFFGAMASTTVATMTAIFVFLSINAWPALRGIPLSSWLETVWNPGAYGEPTWGIVSLLTGTLLVSLVAIVTALPIGMMTAIYLSEMASKSTREIVKPVIELIAGIPSVTLGLLGLIYIAPNIGKLFGISSGLNAVTAGILVSIVTIPGIASFCDDALQGVPQRLRDASTALGTNKWTTIARIVIPAARSELIASGMLGIGRVVGETMIVLMVAGNALAMPTSFLSPVRPMTATIAIEIKEVVFGSLHWNGLFFLGLLLFIITLALNMIAELCISQHDS